MPDPQHPPLTALVWRLSMRWRSAIDRAIAPHGLTNAQYAVLAPLLSLERSGEPPSQRELADFTGLEPLYVSKLARALEQAGLLQRSGHPGDTRAVQLRLTDRGRDAATAAVSSVVGLQTELTAALGGPDSPRSQELAHSLRLLLDTDPPRPDPTPLGQELLMSENRPVNGQDIGQAHYATRAVFERLLTEMDLSFNTSLVLNALAAGHGAVPQSAVIEQLVQGLKITGTEAESIVTVAVDQGLAARTATDSGDRVALTADGAARHRQTREGLVAISGRLYGGLPEDDLIAAQRVLTAVRQRANAELAQ